MEQEYINIQEKDVVERAIGLYSDLLKVRDVSEFFQSCYRKKMKLMKYLQKQKWY